MTKPLWVNRLLPKQQQGKCYFQVFVLQEPVCKHTVSLKLLEASFERTYGSDCCYERLQCFDDRTLIYRVWYEGQVPMWEGHQVGAREYLAYADKKKFRRATHYTPVVQGEINSTYRSLRGLTKKYEDDAVVTVSIAMDKTDRFYIVVNYWNKGVGTVTDRILEDMEILVEKDWEARYKNWRLRELVGPHNTVEIYG